MKKRDCLRLALHHLVKSRLHSGLCCAAVFAGTVAMILIVCIAQFASSTVQKSLDTLGLGGMAVTVSNVHGESGLGMETVQNMERALPEVEKAMPVSVATGTVRAGYRSGEAVLLGVDEKMNSILSVSPLYGTLLPRNAGRRSAAVVVGDDLAEMLYGRVNIVGRKIKIMIGGEEKRFVVSGVVHAQTSALGGAVSALAPYLVYVPYTCICEPEEPVGEMFLSCAAKTAPEDAESAVVRYLTMQKGITADIHVQNLSGIADSVRHISSFFRLIMFGFGAITFFVALIGIFGAMLSAAAERREEIGIYMALGASRREIRTLFLTQSFLLCAGGGTGALAAVFLVLHFSATLLAPDMSTTLALIGVIGVSGILAGLIPAARAANLDPIEAMRK